MVFQLVCTIFAPAMIYYIQLLSPLQWLKNAFVVASITMVCYIMYTMSPEVIEQMGTRYVYFTSEWALVGLLRYLQNMIAFGLSGSPTKSLVKDHFIKFCIAGRLISFFIFIYS